MHAIVRDWLATGEVNERMAEWAHDHFDEIMEETLRDVDELAYQNRPQEALAVMMQTTSFLQTTAARQPKILGKLSKWITKIKNALMTLAQQLGADSISISAWPLSVGLSWPIPAPSGGAVGGGTP